jgi:hypothetical protein
MVVNGKTSMEEAKSEPAGTDFSLEEHSAFLYSASRCLYEQEEAKKKLCRH